MEKALQILVFPLSDLTQSIIPSLDDLIDLASSNPLVPNDQLRAGSKDGLFKLYRIPSPPWTYRHMMIYGNKTCFWIWFDHHTNGWSSIIYLNLLDQVWWNIGRTCCNLHVLAKALQTPLFFVVCVLDLRTCPYQTMPSSLGKPWQAKKENTKHHFYKVWWFTRGMLLSQEHKKHPRPNRCWGGVEVHLPYPSFEGAARYLEIAGGFALPRQSYDWHSHPGNGIPCFQLWMKK